MYPLKVLLLLVGVLLLCSCTVERISSKAADQTQSGDYEAAISTLKKGVAENPDSEKLRSQLVRLQDAAVRSLVEKVAEARKAGDSDKVEAYLARAARLGLEDERVSRLRDSIRIEKAQDDALEKAKDLSSKSQYVAALSVVEQALKLNSRNAELKSLLDLLEYNQLRAMGGDKGQGLVNTKPISLDFREANLRSVLDVMARASGINFVLDKDIKPDTRITVYLRSTKFEDALDLITSTHQLSKKVLDEKTVLVYPNTPEKQREYQEQVVRVFYLANGDAKGAAAFLKSMLKLREPYIDERHNMLSLRDSPENIQLASRLMLLYDQPDPEVVIEAEVVEISKTKLTDLGINYPSGVTLSALVPDGGSQLTLRSLKHLSTGSIGVSIPDVSVNFNSQDSDANVLASPRLRVKNGEKGKIMVGDKVPIITTTTSGSSLAYQSVTYQDVGLRLNVEPTIYADDDVAINVELEVSSLGTVVTTSTGTTAYQINTRNASTLLRLRDGETQLLGGLINKKESTSASKIPGLGDIPLIGRLFGNQNDSSSRTELVLAITPHIVRNLRRIDADNGQFWIGTESNQRLRAPGGKIPQAEESSVAPGAANSRTDAPISSGMAMPSATSTSASATPKPPASGLSWKVPESVKVGQEFQVALVLANKQALRGIPFRVVIPRDKLEFLDVTEGEYFKVDGAKTSFTTNYDKGSGVLGVGVLRNLASGVSGEGNIVNIRLRALSSGEAELSMAGAEPVGSDEPALPITSPTNTKLNIAE
jgi:general secretion pathway protein D